MSVKKIDKQIKKTVFKRYFMIKFDNVSIQEANDCLCKRNELNENANCIFETEKVNLANAGANIEENYQIFTPKFIVDDMINAVGINEIINLNRTIFEPTSGDGAFTTRILELRLQNILDSKLDFIPNLLRAISTIYSVEMDKQLILKQRCNIYTLIQLFCKNNGITIDSQIDTLLKYMICTNFIWGMTNIENHIFSLFRSQVVYQMPIKEKYYEAIEFPVWNISDDLKLSLHYEEVEQ